MARVLVALMLAIACTTMGEAQRHYNRKYAGRSTGKTYGGSEYNGYSKSSSHGRYFGNPKVTAEKPIEAVTKLCKKLDVVQAGGTQQAVVCENFILVLECPKGTMLNILRANYGRSSTTVCDPAAFSIPSNLEICVTNTSTNIVATQCEGQKRCQFKVSNALFGDTCPNTYKFLEVDFRCDKESVHLNPVITYEKKDEEEMVHQAYACQKNLIVLECPRWSAITVTRASYRTSTNSRCDPDVLGIRSASATCVTDSIDLVAALCNGRERCQFFVKDSLLTNTCPYTFKFLEVDFTCEEKEGGLEDDAECQRSYSFDGYSYYSFVQWIKVLQKWVMKLQAY